MQAGNQGEADAKDDSNRLADDDRDWERERTLFQGSKRHAGVHETEEKEVPPARDIARRPRTG